MDLVTQIGTNVQTRNIGLTTLASLAKNHTTELSGHAIYVAHILGMFSHKMSIITIFGHKHIRHKFDFSEIIAKKR